MGSKKKQSSGYYYFLGMHMIFCHGPIDRVTQILADEKLALNSPDWTGGERIPFAVDLFGGPEKEGGFAGPVELQMGGPAQMPSSYLLTHLPGTLIPAFRGVVGMVFKQVYIGTQTYLKKIAIRAQRIHVRQDGLPQWYDAKAEIAESTGTGQRVEFVGTNNAGQAYHAPTVDDWSVLPYTSSQPIGKTIITAGDRYLAFSNGALAYTDDGVNWLPVDFTGHSGASTIRSAAYFQGLVVYGESLNGYSVSADRGLTYTFYGFPTYPRVGVVVAGATKLMACDLSSYKLLVTANPSTGWTQSYDTAADLADVRQCGAYGNGVFRFGGAGGSPVKPCIISVTEDGFGAGADALPAGTTNASVQSIAFQNNNWVACTDDGKLLYKNGSSAWANGIALPGSCTVTAGGGYFFVNNGVNFSKRSADGITWTTLTFPGTYPSVITGGVTYDSRKAQKDMNPAHIIRECLTDPDWGMGYAESDIDDVSFTNAADTLYDEVMGISLLWNKQITIEDFIKEIIKHINAALFVDRRTGLFNLKLIRQDYDKDALITLDPSNIEKVNDFTLPQFGELTNSVTVQYWNGETNKDASLTVSDDALCAMQGGVINTTVDYSGFTNPNIASRVAQRDLKTLSTPIVSCTLYCNRAAADLNIGECFKWSWPDYGINQLVMRVTGMGYGDGKQNRVRIQCTQDVYDMPDIAINVPGAPEWVDPNQAPIPAAFRLPFEVPYLEAVQQFGQTAVDNILTTDPTASYAGIAAVRPTPATINARLYTNAGGGYANQDIMDFTPSATLVAGVGKLDTSIELENGIDLDLPPDGSWFQIGNEILVKVGFLAPIMTVKRGALDTVPEEHATGARLFFWDVYSGTDTTEYNEGEEVDIKVCPITGQGELALLDAPTDSLEFVGRMARPYVPGNFKIDAEYYPEEVTAILVSWAHRDRKLQTGGTYLGFLDGSIGPEAGTTYNLRLYNDTPALVHSETGITGTSFDLTSFATFAGSYRIELESERDGIISYQKQSHLFEFSTTNYRATEAGDTRITESGDKRILE